MTQKDMIHKPVLLKEVIGSLSPQPGQFVIDGTVNGGGHAEVILQSVGPNGKLLGLDWDEEIAESAAKKFAGAKNAIILQGNYRNLPQVLKENNFPKADGLLLDLGFSSAQLGNGRGMSFSKNEPLYMTYSRAEEPLAGLLPKLKEDELTQIIRKYGEEKYARPIAAGIKARLKKGKILSTDELAETIRKAVPGNYEKGRIDPATRTFQALRIYANDELGNLETLLGELREIVKPGGRVAIISFHSLEDRIVKHEFDSLAKEQILKILTKKPIIATEEEIIQNPRSRSAKLRVAEII